MGVPAFFRWLSRKYPSIVVHCVEEKPKIVNGTKIPVDSSQKNPNNVEFDNLYLDMNGIIHPCCHPENKPAPKDEEEMMVAIFEYIDRIFAIVRPRRLLYMAIDGVAPRAKMNQQRSRRFRASKETVEKVESIARIRKELEAKGVQLPPEKAKEEHFDSNCITPGTPFMDRLAKCLHYYIHDRLNSDPAWRNIEVILSDANVPGEGEHKIMDYIRRQRSNPDHDASTKHCLCGADADLIMLGLATHEANFTIIREEFKPNQARPCEICGQFGHTMDECTGAAKEKQGKFDELTKPIVEDVEFIFIRLYVLREYLAIELNMENLPFPFDLERVIDDWVFMCFFVGNDFLPHLPSLEIREGAIDRLVALYKRVVYKTGGFVTKSGYVELSRVQLIMTELGEVEDEIFKKRQENEMRFQAREKDRKKRMKRDNGRPSFTPGGQFSPMTPFGTPSPVQNPRQEAYQGRMMSTQANTNSPHTPENSKTGASSDSGILGKRKREDSDDEEDAPEDNVKLWEDGFKDRYYEYKFNVKSDDIAFRENVAAAYVEGLCWVLRYYYQGCASWNWYFPYHYAPFASDFVNIGDIIIDFKSGCPFNPLEQLMAVFPAGSKQHVPEPWGKLMYDPESPIIDFYPTDFKIDLNGKKYAWQGVALLPFVNEKRLLRALKSVYSKLTAEEKRRNVRGKDRLYVRQGHLGYDFLTSLYENNSNKDLEIDMNAKLFSGMAGTVILSGDVIKPKATVFSPLDALPDIPGNAAVCISFNDPQYPDSFIFPAERLKSARDPPKCLAPGQGPVYDRRNNFGGGGRRPHGGMAPYKRASLGEGGHRMLNHSMRIDPNNTYGNVPPPSQYGNRRPNRNFSRGNFRPSYGQSQSPYNQSYGQSQSPYNQSRGHSRSHSQGHSNQPWGSSPNTQSYGSPQNQAGWGPMNTSYGNSSQSASPYGNFSQPPSRYPTPPTRYDDRNTDRRMSGRGGYSSYGTY